METNGKNKKLMKVAGIVIAIVVVILVFNVIADLFAGKPDSVISVYDSEEEQSTIYVNGKVVDTIDGEASIYSNMNHSAYYIRSDGDIYYLKGKKLKEVESDATVVAVANNSKEALIMNEDAELYLYNGSKLKEITDETVSSAVISGDGKYYAFNSEGDAYFGKKPGKEEKVKDVEITYISENGKYIYACESADSEEGTSDSEDIFSEYYGDSSGNFNLLLVDKKGETEEIEKNVTNVIALNADGTEIMYTTEDGTFVSANGKEGKEVTEGKVTGVYYKDTNDASNGKFRPIASFKKTVCTVMDGEDYLCCVISRKYEAEEITDECSSFYGVDDKCSKIFYVDGDGDLYYAKAKKDADGKKLASDVSHAVISEDGKTIYYVEYEDEENAEGTVYYIKGTSKAKEVGDYEGISGIAMTEKGAYLKADGDIYYLNGKKAKEVEDIENMFMDMASKEVYGYEDDTLYSVDGTKGKKLKGEYEQISSYDYVY